MIGWITFSGLKKLLVWFTPAALFGLALALPTPLMAKHRYPGLVALVVCGAVYAASAARLWLRPWQWRHAPRLARGLMVLLSATLALAQEVGYQRLRRGVLEADGQRLRRVGPHLMVGYTDLAEVEPLVRRGAVGGVFVTARNLRRPGTGAGAGLAAELSRLQRLRRASGLPRLLVAADQEGGKVSRLSPPLTALPPLSSLLEVSADGNDADLGDRVRRYAAVHGRELARLGVNINFGPVVDLRLERSPGTVDLYSKISDRAISADPTTVTKVALVYSRSLERHGVLPTLKHFPGLGRVSADTHFFTSSLDREAAQLERADWRPFRVIGGQTGALIMLGHVKLPRLDPVHLASSSRTVVQGVIRGRWGHQGLLVTDDLCMLPVWNAPGGLGGSAVRSLNAGVDLLLVTQDPRQIYLALAALLAADRAGRLGRGALSRSRRRLAAIRTRMRTGVRIAARQEGQRPMSRTAMTSTATTSTALIQRSPWWMVNALPR